MNLNEALEWMEGIKESGKVGRSRVKKFLLPIQARLLLEAEKERRKKAKKKEQSKLAA